MLLASPVDIYPAQAHGFMFGRSFEDPDGHLGSDVDGPEGYVNAGMTEWCR